MRASTRQAGVGSGPGARVGQRDEGVYSRAVGERGSSGLACAGVAVYCLQRPEAPSEYSIPRRVAQQTSNR